MRVSCSKRRCSGAPLSPPFAPTNPSLSTAVDARGARASNDRDTRFARGRRAYAEAGCLASNDDPAVNRRMDRKRLGLVVAGVGIVIAAVSALVDELGLGTGGFGWKQITGVVIGLVLSGAGAAIALATRSHVGAAR